MMINAYPEIYLNKAMTTTGDIFDCAVNDLQIAGGEFVKLFVNSTACRRLEQGDTTYLIGKSGIEIALEIVKEMTGKQLPVKAELHYGRSAEYWTGWAACYYQWKSNRTYAEIFRAVSFEEFLELYPTLHEADVTKTAEVLEGRMREIFPETNLKRIRTAYGCSQSKLAALSGVSLRSIQMYEQRKKDINRAQAQSVYRLAKALGCHVEDLLER